MIYLVALFVPWFALMLIGRVFQAIVNFVLCTFAVLILVLSLGIFHGVSAILWLLCVVHAILAINAAKQDRRNRALIDAIARNRR
jgi:hypothetical protein